MKKVLLFAGTTEGRMLSEYFVEHKTMVDVCVATEYREIVLPESEYLRVRVGRINKEEITALLQEENYGLVIDATHPYAVNVTENIKGAAAICQIPYERVIRQQMDTEDAIFVNTITDAVEFLNRREGHALITTGSKELAPYTKVKGYEERLTFRMLPTVEAMQACVDNNIKAKRVIAMQGPFSEEMNYLTLKELGAKYIVTKESGSIGGFYEKIAAAKRAGALVVVIRRPGNETGHTIEEMKELLRSGGM